jgi:hypothetical protein
MRGTRIEKEVEICATHLAIKTTCMSTNTKKYRMMGKVQNLSNSVCQNPLQYTFLQVMQTPNMWQYEAYFHVVCIRARNLFTQSKE